MAHRNFDDLHKERMKLLASTKSQFILPENYLQKTFEEIVHVQPGSNKCFTLYDLHAAKIVKWHLVKQLFGYNENEFTIEAINNCTDKIIYEKDMIHKKRYDKIVYGLLAGGNVFQVLRDYYSINMRIINRIGQIIPIKRNSYIFTAETNRPLLQLDIWEKPNRYKVNHVFADIIIANELIADKITEQFYYANLEELNLAFTKRALIIMHFKVMGESNNTISKRLCVKEQTIANFHTENFHQLRDIFPEEIAAIASTFFTQKSNEKKKAIGEHINVFREFCKTYGLYPVPESIIKSIEQT